MQSQYLCTIQRSEPNYQLQTSQDACTGQQLQCIPLQYFVHVSFHSAPIQPTITPCLLHMSHNCSIPSATDIYHSEAFTLIAKVTIIPSAVFIELLISIYAIKFYSIAQSRYGPQCYVWRLYLVHVLASWNILIAIQLFSMIAIALSTLLLIHPQVTVFLLLFLAMVLVSLTLCTTYLLYHCQQQRRRWDCNPKDCGTNFFAQCFDHYNYLLHFLQYMR